MTDKTQNLSIRLIRADYTPEKAVRSGVTLKDWARLAGAKIALGSAGGDAPRWAEFLDLAPEDKNTLRQRSSFGLVFLPVDGRWFAVSFGHGHSKIDPLSLEQDFGLRVVLNAVDHKKLRSADLSTPDANTLSRRSQTSRASERSAFEIDPERDIVRGLLGEPKDKTFATKISGGDALSLRRKIKVDDLPAACSRALKLAAADEYKEEFGWIDQIKHVREADVLAKLTGSLVQALDEALKDPSKGDDLGLAYPAIYDPDRASRVRFRGYGSSDHFPDLEISHYLDGLRSKGITSYVEGFLRKHSVEECDDDGAPSGGAWPVQDCLVYELELDGQRFTLSGGRWYRIDPDLANEVRDYFDNIEKVELPPAQAGDNEKTYNARVAAANADLLCMDVKLVKPSDASSPIEVCDFLGADGRLIHIKDKTESSRLSHLFNQGLVSAIVLKRDAPFRDRVLAEVAKQPGGGAFSTAVAASNAPFDADRHKVVFGVLTTTPEGKAPQLPFFSLISLRHAARRIADELGYKVAFSWVRKPGVGVGKKRKRAGGTTTT
ncbi:DUF6119 family protein [Brevundimonas sp.]|uniref:DUF6119 family protein n=1 Tax=Brevundimonas sp. TaxID=1871086 RepID=UPI00122B09F6|nr:DUF6119 family protein [Brevundimonas sp.]TAJ64005.1 MAG: hypothetical protein EPO49_06155 [Brevundimonas sp.]